MGLFCRAGNVIAMALRDLIAPIAIENAPLFEEIQNKNRHLQQASEYKSQFVSMSATNSLIVEVQDNLGALTSIPCGCGRSCSTSE